MNKNSREENCWYISPCGNLEGREKQMWNLRGKESYSPISIHCFVLSPEQPISKKAWFRILKQLKKTLLKRSIKSWLSNTRDKSIANILLPSGVL